MDGNFSAEHMRCRTGEADIPLATGMAFMANPDSYKAHLNSGQEIDQVCRTPMSDSHVRISKLTVPQPSTCNTYKAIEKANSRRPHLDVTGIGATTCSHGFFVPTSVVDFQKGERLVQSITQSDSING
jgi:Kyakuja-Dileera-Zisupton transposase